MSASSNYNAITNLTETVIDYLVVDTAEIDTALIENLDCNVGTIDTLTSTTATLTSANIPTLTTTTAGITTANITTENTTTSNTTNLNTNNIQANPNSSDITIYTSHTGAFNLGNTSNTNGIRMNNKLQMATDKQIEITPTGHLACETIRGYSFGNAVSLYLTQTGAISFGNTSNTNAITINQNITLPANKIITLNATGGKIVCNTYEGTAVGSSISLFGTTTAGITIGGSSSGITLGDNVSLGTNDNLTLSGTGLITTPNLRVTGLTANKLVLTDAESDLVSSSWGQTDLVILSANNTFTGTNTFNGILYVNTLRGILTGSTISLYSTTTAGITLGGSSSGITLGDNTTLPASKTITLNSSGGKVLCNVYTGTAGSSTITIGESGNTGDLSIFKTIVSSNTYSGTNTFSGGNTHSGSNTFSGATNTFNNTILGNTIQGTTAGSSISLYGTTTASVNFATTLIDNALTIGNSSFVAGISTGSVVINLPLTCNQNITLASGKIITLNSTGGKVLSNVYTGTTTSSNLTIGESGNTGTLTIYKTIVSPTMSGTLSVNDIQGTTTSSSITLFTNSSASSPTISIGNVSGGTITINPNASFSGSLKCDTINATTSTSNGVLFGNITAGLVNIAGSLTGFLNIGASVTDGIISIGSPSVDVSIDTGYIDLFLPTFFRQNLTLNTGINIITSSTSKVYCNVYTGTATSSDITIGVSGDTGNLSIFKTITSSNTYSGTNTFSGGNTHSGSNTFSGTTNTFNNTLACNTFRSTAVGSAVSLFSTTTAGITIGGSSSGILLDSNVSLGTGDTLTTSTTGSILCPTYNSTSATQALSIGTSNTTTNVSIGTGLTTGVLVLGSTNVFSSNYSAADLYIRTLAGTDKTLYANTIRATTIASVVQPASLYSTNTTQNITLGAGLTTGLISIGNRDTVTTGYTLFQHRLRQTLKPGGFDNSSYWNVAIGSANNIFQSSILSASAMPPIYVNAQANRWSVWESDTQSEGSFIAQNGDTMIICNPCDAFAINFQDEDSMGVADGFKMDLDGVITVVSDRRIKRDINPIPVGSDLLDKLSLIEYINYKKKAQTEEKYYRNGKLRDKYQKIRKGLIAQDVKKIFPEVVEKEGEYHMMKYAEVDIYFNMGVQELIKRDKEKQIIIDDLTARLVRLEQLILNP